MKHKKSSPDSYYVYGLNPVTLISEKAPERVIEIKVINNLAHKFKHLNCVVVSPKELNHIFPDLSHQGIVATIAPKQRCDLDSLISSSANDKIAVLDRITDIGNIGAIIRSALAFNIKKFIIPKHDGCSNMARLAKSSSGYSELGDICEVVNLSHAVDELKENGYWCLGLDGMGREDISKLKDYPKLAIILGNEHQGIREGLRKSCDLLVKIPMTGEVESLNVAVASAIAFYNTV